MEILSLVCALSLVAQQVDQQQPFVVVTAPGLEFPRYGRLDVLNGIRENDIAKVFPASRFEVRSGTGDLRVFLDKDHPSLRRLLDLSLFSDILKRNQPTIQIGSLNAVEREAVNRVVTSWLPKDMALPRDYEIGVGALLTVEAKSVAGAHGIRFLTPMGEPSLVAVSKLASPRPASRIEQYSVTIESFRAKKDVDAYVSGLEQFRQYLAELKVTVGEKLRGMNDMFAEDMRPLIEDGLSRRQRKWSEFPEEVRQKLTIRSAIEEQGGDPFVQIRFSIVIQVNLGDQSTLITLSP